MIEIGSKTAEKNSAQTNRQADRLAATLRGSRRGCNPNRHYDVIDDVITRKL